MIAIVLVGGFGTRLQSVVPDLPKPMAPIENKPFLAYLLHYLQQHGVNEVIFPIHYLGEKISEFFANQYRGMKIHYIAEEQPLGTGGAIVNALQLVTTSDPVFVLNGDTFVKLDYELMLNQHRQTQAQFTIGLRAVADCTRYGSVLTQNNIVTQFAEKGRSGPGFIHTSTALNHRRFAPMIILLISAYQKITNEHARSCRSYVKPDLAENFDHYASVESCRND